MGAADAVSPAQGAGDKALTRPEALSRPEQPVLEDAFNGWIDLLRKEAARRADTHPLWAHLAKGFQSGGLTEQARERFQQSMRSFQSSEAEEVERTARAIYEELEKNPVVLNTPARRQVRPGRGGHRRLRRGRRHRLARLHHRAAGRLADAPAGRVARLAGGGRPARADAAAAAGTAQAASFGADGGVADEVAGHRRLVVRAAATGPAPHPDGGAAAGRMGAFFEELESIRQARLPVLR